MPESPSPPKGGGLRQERKGLLTKEQEKFFAELLDDAILFPNPLIERLDKAAFKLIISAVDDNLADRIPEGWQSPLEPVIDACMAGSWEEAGENAAKLINQKIDIPGIDEESEGAIINGVIQLIIGAVISRASVEN
jgi:hypothetical protein